MKQFIAFIRKEFYHILRDRRTMLILIGMPIVQIILFGFAISTEVRNIQTAILAPSTPADIRLLIDRLDASEYFTVKYLVRTEAELNKLFRQNKIELAVAFSEDLNRRRPGSRQIQVIADATDPNQAITCNAYLQGILSPALAELQAASPSGTALNLHTRLLYNPQMRSAYNFVPGVMGLILMLICAMMTSISIVREKETGTMEVLLVSPVRPIYIVVSKMVPYFVLSCINLATILLLSVFVLGVPVAGSLAALWLVSLIYIIANLSLGLLISTMAHQQVIALMFSGLLLMMPTMLLSGMVFPIESMPWPLRGISCILPARWYITAVRKLMIQGLPMIYAWKEIVILASMAVVLIGASLKKLNNRLE